MTGSYLRSTQMIRQMYSLVFLRTSRRQQLFTIFLLSQLSVSCHMYSVTESPSSGVIVRPRRARGQPRRLDPVTMEVIATEFPDIYQWFEAPETEVKMEVEVRTEVDVEMFTARNSPAAPELQQTKPPHSSPSHGPDGEIDVEEISTILDGLDDDPCSGLRSLQLELGCRWTDATQQCAAGEQCEFVRQMLGLDALAPAVAYTPRPRLQRIMVVKQTPAGLVKVTETQQSFTAEQIRLIQQLSNQEQIKCIQVYATNYTITLKERNIQNTAIENEHPY